MAMPWVSYASQQSSPIVGTVSGVVLQIVQGPRLRSAVVCGLALLLWEQYKLWRVTKGITGPKWTMPFLGGLIEMVWNPYEFWERQKDWSRAKGLNISWNVLAGRLLFFVTDTTQVRHVLQNNSPSDYVLKLHPSAEGILGKTNIAFMTGVEHKRLRNTFMELFTRKALSMYVTCQDKIVRQWLEEWAALPEPVEMRDLLRLANLHTSQTVFAGPYLQDEEERQEFSEAYLRLTEGFLGIPLWVPGTMVWKARNGRRHVVKVLTRVVQDALANAEKGVEPACLVDFWVRAVTAADRDLQAAGEPPLEFNTHERMAEVIMDFLFASQDATSAGLTWVVAVMADHPEVYARVREEQYAVRGTDLSRPLDGEVLEQLVYTRNCIKELLRYRPVAPMLIQEAQATQTIPGCPFMIPKGTYVSCSLVASCENGFSDPTKFDPDRWSKERNEGTIHAKHWLPFGSGPHRCPGQEYAQNQLATFLSLLAANYDLRRDYTPDSQKMKYLPTLYPHDCLIKFQPIAPRQ